MEIALCHRIPRERVFYLALSLLLISLLLQAICIGLRSVTGGGGKFKVVSTQDGAIIGYVHVAVLSGMTLQSEEVGCTSSSESVGSSSSCYQSLCSLQLPTFDKKCVQYLSACYGVEICAIIALVFSSLSFLYCLGFSWGKTLLQVDITLLSGLCLPCSFLCAVLIIFFTSVVPAGADAIYMYASSKSEIALEENIRLDFFRGNIINLYVSSACFCFAGFISVLCHGIWWLFFKAHSESDEEECMRDDYAQQKEVLTSHAKAVRAEIKFKGEIDPGFIPPLTTKV